MPTFLPRRAVLHAVLALLLVNAARPPWAAAQTVTARPDAIDRVKPAIVAVGTFDPSRTPRFKFYGTGFAVGNGTLVATNAHVLPETLDQARKEALVVAVGSGNDVSVRTASRQGVDAEHDVALLQISGAPLPALRLRAGGRVREGEEYLMTGFPLGTVLGLFPVTHRAMISAVVPIAMPLPSANALDTKVVRRVRRGTFPVLQLDATAYPGSSGSPLYDAATGEVVGVLNMVFVKGTKEAAISAPSGITYAIPVVHLQNLLSP